MCADVVQFLGSTKDAESPPSTTGGLGGKDLAFRCPDCQCSSQAYADSFGPKVKVQEVCPAELTPHQLDLWSRFQSRNAALISPYFCPEFTLAVGRVRQDARVAIIDVAGTVVGFFPYQRRAFGLAAPIGGPLSDYQGIIAHPDISIDAAELLRCCGLAGFEFTNLLASQVAFKPYQRRTDPSHQIDLSEGLDAFFAERRQAGSDVISTTMRKRRKLEREVGALRWVLKDTDPASLDMLIEWKRQQYRRTRALDGFKFGWPLALLKDLHRIDAPGFGGVLSTLWVGDRMIAGHMGMRSRTAWHYWFPAYDPAYGHYSPGQIMLLMMIETCADLGTHIIDMGKGEYRHKLRLTNRATDVAEGYVGRPSVPTFVRTLRHGIEHTFERLPVGSFSQWPRKAFRRIDAYLSHL